MGLESNNAINMTDEARQQKRLAVGALIVFVILVALLSLIVLFLVKDPARASLIRDIMVVLMALEMLLIFTTAGLLILQVTRLINLTQNEIKPLLEAANETIYTFNRQIRKVLFFQCQETPALWAAT